MVLQVLPHLRRQVLVGMADSPIVGHGADLLDFMVEEVQFLRSKLGLGNVVQFGPVRRAGEKLTFPPHTARLQCLPFGLRHHRQDAPVDIEHRPGEDCAAQRRHDQQQGRRQQHGPRKDQWQAPALAQLRRGKKPCAACHHPGNARRARVHQDGEQDQSGKREG